MRHSPQTVNLTAWSKRELLESVVNELVKWGVWAMTRRPSSDMRW
jgi:hypothetical protein